MTFFSWSGLADVGVEGFGGLGAEGLVGEVGAGGADDAGFFGDLAVAEAVVEGGEELSQCEIAGGTEDDAVEGIDGFYGHGASSCAAVQQGCLGWWRRSIAGFAASARPGMRFFVFALQ